MSLWNVAYNTNFFWDGRGLTLEEQSIIPLTTENEMAASPEEIEAELQAIPEYVDPFVQDMLGNGFDIIWDGSGANNRFDEPNASASFPPVLPKSSWPDPVYNLYWRVLNFVVGLVS